MRYTNKKRKGGIKVIKELDKKSFEELLEKKDKLIIIDFFAKWCMPCKMFSPIFEKISQQYTEVEFGKIDIDLNEEIVSKYSIEGVPTIVFIKNGILINQEIGFRSENEMQDLINKYNNKK